MIPTTPLGTAVHLDPGQAGDDAEASVGGQVPGRGAGVVAGGERDVQRLVEGVLAGLARLPHDQVEDLVLPVEHQVVQAQQGGGALRRAASAPRRPAPSRARANARSTSASSDCGTWASGAPSSGERTSTVRPVEAHQRGRSGRRRSPGPAAYDAVGSCSGSCGPSTTGSPAGVGVGALMYREYVSPVSPDTPAGPVRPAPHRHPGRGHARGARDARGDAGQRSRPRRCLTCSTRRAACSTRSRKAGLVRVRASTARCIAGSVDASTVRTRSPPARRNRTARAP